MLFSGARSSSSVWLEGVAAAPADAEPARGGDAGLEPVAEMFAERHAFARIRARIIEANPELQERELIKLQTSPARSRPRCSSAASRITPRCSLPRRA